ncbi:MAG: ArsR family transcriptional regulator [Chloroflexaceae bacterium]|nr:ArsR family transcriptional regulator [Chloroflexaceae bacterium]NJO05475.1 ArsR family transcriptional regulator [Chloroflexaceae bacterium]
MKAPTQAERKEHGTTRQSILFLLRRHGQMTAAELSQELRIGAVGVRQHLTLLERDGLVEVAGLRRSVGRPSYLYALTAEAETHFPKAYDELALSMLHYMEQQGGVSTIVQMFETDRSTKFEVYARRLRGKTRSEQVAELAAMLTQHGYMCEYEELRDGSFLLTQYNCPVDCIARRYPQLCAQELLLYQDLLGMTIERKSSIVEGQTCCRYLIAPHRSNGR